MKHPETQNVQQHLTDYLAGDKAAFDKLVDAFERGLLRYATGLLGDRSAAQDVVQDTFIRLLKAAKTVRDGAKLSSWLYRTCRNLAIDRMRKEREMALPESDAVLADPRVDPAGEVEKRDLFAKVQANMRKLTPNQRDCITLKVLEGRSYKEISAITGLSVSNVGFQIHDGLKRLSAFVGGSRKGGGRDDV